MFCIFWVFLCFVRPFDRVRMHFPFFFPLFSLMRQIPLCRNWVSTFPSPPLPADFPWLFSVPFPFFSFFFVREIARRPALEFSGVNPGY